MKEFMEFKNQNLLYIKEKGIDLLLWKIKNCMLVKICI